MFFIIGLLVNCKNLNTETQGHGGIFCWLSLCLRASVFNLISPNEAFYKFSKKV